MSASCRTTWHTRRSPLCPWKQERRWRLCRPTPSSWKSLSSTSFSSPIPLWSGSAYVRRSSGRRSSQSINQHLNGIEKAQTFLVFLFWDLFCLRGRFLSLPWDFLPYYTMILRRMRIVVGDADGTQAFCFVIKRFSSWYGSLSPYQPAEEWRGGGKRHAHHSQTVPVRPPQV